MDPDPTFHSNADPDPDSASNNNADPFESGSGSGTLVVDQRHFDADLRIRI